MVDLKINMENRNYLRNIKSEMKRSKIYGLIYITIWPIFGKNAKSINNLNKIKILILHRIGKL